MFQRVAAILYLATAILVVSCHQHAETNNNLVKHSSTKQHGKEHVQGSSSSRFKEFLHDLEMDYCYGSTSNQSGNDTTSPSGSNVTSDPDADRPRDRDMCRRISGFLSRNGTSRDDLHGEGHHHDDHTAEPSGKHQSPSTWGYAILACLIISLVGLVAVAIIPLMHRVIYNHLLQFLVSLAIGSLSGDALLHLIPHAMVPHDHGPTSGVSHDHHHSHDDHQHSHPEHDRRPVWLGLTALAGLFLFFIVERLVGYCSERKRKQQSDKTNKYKSTNVQTTNGMMIDSAGDRKEIGGKVAPSSTLGTASCEEMLMVVHASKDIKKMAHDAHEEMHKNCETPGVDEAHLVHSTGGHHHHSHDAPTSVAAVAWMVIVGDGFHNFADGIAIGSAFASSVQDGLSTSIAIFCHELPHELGDFAMLLSAGMSGKQALVYNCVSSILCLVGMCVGVGVGNLVSATPWIFMLVAGMFIYIALVDMLPEMKSVDPKRGEHPMLHFGLQVMGMLTGCSIMLIIALFESQITVPL